MTTFFTGRRGLITALVVLAVGLALPFIPGLYDVVAINIMCWALFAVALDLMLGYGGMLSFGHAMFWGTGAYAALYVYNNYGGSLPLAFLTAIVFSFLLAIVTGYIAIRRVGIYLAMITLALAEMIKYVCVEASSITGGEDGLHFGARGSFFGIPLSDDHAYYYFVLVIVAIVLTFTIRVVTSPFGQVMAAMRENEQRARSLGYDTKRYKFITFIMSGTIAGLAGALYGVGNRLAGLDLVDWHTSGAVVMMTILGGIGTLYGPMVGAALFEMLQYFIPKTPIGDKTFLVEGIIFAVIILAARRGIVGEILHTLSLRHHPRVVEDDTKGNALVPDPVATSDT